MISARKTSICLLFAVFLSMPLYAQTQNEHALVDTITQKLAVSHQLQETPADIRTEFSQNPFQISSGQNKKLLHAFDRAFDASLMIRDFKKALQQNIAQHETSDIQEWLMSTHAKSVTHANETYFTLQGKRKRVMAMYELDQNKPSAKRTTLITELADTTSAASQLITSSAIIARSVVKALNNLSTQRKFSDAMIDRIVQNIKAQVQATADHQVQQKLMIRYYGVKIPALRDYVMFLKSTPGAQLNAAINKSMLSAYRSAGQRFIHSVTDHS